MSSTRRSLIVLLEGKRWPREQLVSGYRIIQDSNNIIKSSPSNLIEPTASCGAMCSVLVLSGMSPRAVMRESRVCEVPTGWQAQPVGETLFFQLTVSGKEEEEGES